MYNNIGLVYNDQGKYDSALVNYKKSLRMREKTFGENNLKVATSCYNIGCVFNNQSKYDSALAYYKKTLTIEKNILGECHPQTLKVRNSIAMTVYQLSLQNNTYRQFISNHCFTFSVSAGSSSEQKGMSGEYVLLEFGDWTQDGETSIYKKIEELKEKTKSIVVLKDGFVQQFSFNGPTGAQIGVKEISEKEKQEIDKAYNDWKKKNK